MIEAIPIISVLNLGLNLVAVWQRHETLKHAKQNGQGGAA